MIARISRWGNSLGIRIPKSALEKVRFREGDDVDIVAADDDSLVLRRAVPRPSLDELVAAITPENRHDDAFPEPAGNERW